jgi:hypothetical protein
MYVDYVDLFWISRKVVELLWICCTPCCTANPQQIEKVEFAQQKQQKSENNHRALNTLFGLNELEYCLLINTYVFCS